MSIHWICGPMFAGKSTELQRLAERYRIAGRHVLAVKPRMDTRGDTATITTHAGTKISALCVEKIADIVATGPTMVICIDEGHMFPGMRSGWGSNLPSRTTPPSDLPEGCAALAASGHTVVVASLAAGHERSTLGLLNTSAFLAQCDSLTWLQAVCCGCGVDTASVTHRHTTGPSLVGGAEQYEALCRRCHNNKMGN